MKMTKDQFDALLNCIRAQASNIAGGGIYGTQFPEAERATQEAYAALTSDEIIAGLDTAPSTDKPAVTLRIDASDMTDRLDKFEKWWNDQMAEAQTEPPEPRFTYKEWHEKVGHMYVNERGGMLLATPDAMQRIRSLETDNVFLTKAISQANDKARALHDQLHIVTYQRRQILNWAERYMTPRDLYAIRQQSTQQPPPVKHK